MRDDLPASQRLALLRRFEPELRFTKGELFFPMSVEDYVAHSSLVATRGDAVEEIAARGTLSLDRLAELGRAHAGRALSLNHVEQSLDRAAYRGWRRRRRSGGDRFRPSSRFAAVGLLARLVDFVMRITLLLRGRVPGGFAAAAQQAYAASPHYGEAYYYGQVTQDGGYTVLQYWYCYAMNDWRSTFGGINDHECDWEQVTVYLVDAQVGTPKLAWVAFSSHDEVGDDLRRRWDDPDITFVGEHPVVFAGAGSHSGAYLKGEYLIGAALPLPRWMQRLAAVFSDDEDAGSDGSSGLRIPYIDYKRGDGVIIGTGHQREWTAVLIDDTTGWVRDFSGLWGLDTSDPFGGERAPAGPRYERDGTVRRSWGQPVAWAGLDKVAPTREAALARMTQARDALTDELAGIDELVEARRERLRGATAAERALGLPPTQPGTHVRELADALDEARTSQAQLRGLLDGVERALTAPPPSEPVHGHLRHRNLPIDVASAPLGRVLRIWTAASASILLAAMGILLLLGDAPLAAILWVAGVMLVIEAVLRRRAVSVLAGAAVLMLAFAGVWGVLSLVLGNLQQGFGVLLLLGAVYLAVATLLESIKTR